MKTVQIACAMTVGIFKSKLSKEERKRFRDLIEYEHKNFIGGSGTVFEGQNSLVFCFSLLPGAQRTDPEITGGACVVVYRGDTYAGKETESLNESSTFCQNESKIDPLSVTRLNSAWSTAIINDVQGDIHIGRDIAGAQSMYYALIDGIFYFTSSLTCFRKLPFNIDQDAISDFLHFLYIPAPHTIYKGVRSLLPGQIVSFSNNKTRNQVLPNKNYLINHKQGNLTLPDDEYLTNFEGYLQQSVRSACMINGKVALFLSGGKDSSTLAISVKESGLQNVDFVTLSFDDTSIDESESGRGVAQHLNIPFQILKFNPSTYLQHWPGFVSSLGQPFGDPASMPIYVAVKELQDRYDVYLDGTGNDRYFGITTTWQEKLAWYIHRFVPQLNRLPWGYLRFFSSHTFDTFRLRLSRPREEQFVSWKGWTYDEILNLTGRRPNWKDIPLYSMYHNVSSPMIHKTRTLCEIWEPEAAYRKIVQIVNTNGKAVHFPYLDQSLVRYCESLPASLKYRGETNKIIIRLLLQKYLPQQIATKRKGYFIFPKEYILRVNNYESIRCLLSRDGIYKQNSLEPSIVKIYCKKYINGDKDLEDRIWAIVLLYSWLEFGRS